MKLFAVLLAVLTLVTLCTGCGDDGVLTEPANIAFVLGITNNNPVLNPDMEELSSLSGAAGSTYCCVLSDGTPHEIVSGTVPDFTDQGYTKEMLSRIAASVEADLAAQLSDAAPDAEEVDVAEAMKLAVRNLRANAVEGRKNLLVLHLSGIGTSGAIDMTKTPIAAMDVSASVAALVQTLDLDLSGISVVWYCMGDVSGDQDALSDEEQIKLRSFYEELLLGLGAESVTFRTDSPLSGAYAFPQNVSCMEAGGSGNLLEETVTETPMPTPESTPVPIPEPTPEPEDIFAESEVLSFDEVSISFTKGTAELADKTSAAEALGYVVKYMNDVPEFRLLVCGTTACWGGEEYCRELSGERAAAICQLLAEQGIDPSRLTALGLGYDHEFYIWDQTPEGELDDAIAPLNRTVKLLPLDSDTAARLLAGQ